MRVLLDIAFMEIEKEVALSVKRRRPIYQNVYYFVHAHFFFRVPLNICSQWNTLELIIQTIIQLKWSESEVFDMHELSNLADHGDRLQGVRGKESFHFNLFVNCTVCTQWIWLWRLKKSVHVWQKQSKGLQQYTVVYYHHRYNLPRVYLVHRYQHWLYWLPLIL